MKYRFSCDGQTEGIVDTKTKMLMGEIVEITIRYLLSVTLNFLWQTKNAAVVNAAKSL